MSEYIITVTNGANSGTIKPDVGFSYTENLNEINEAELRFSSLSTITRTLITIGTTILIQKDGANAFFGFVDTIDNVTAGGIAVHASGHEGWLSKEPRVYAGSPWNSTASATIATAIIGESTHLTLGSAAAGLSIDLRLEKTDTLWNALGMICKKTGQDVDIDYSNTSAVKISIVDHKGLSSSVIVLNNGFELTNPRYTQGYPTGNSITVYGKGDGTNQIKSDNAHGQDAGSIATYGTIYRPVINRNVMSVDEANQLADKEVVLTKDPTEVYKFTVTDITLPLEAGDIITINAEDLGISSTDVRITQVNRGINGTKEFLEIQVANANYAKILKLRDRYLSDITRQSLQESTQMQGNSNIDIWGSSINAATNYPLKVGIYIDPESFVDQAGKLRINFITLDYDITPFKQGFGTASYTGSNPPVQNSSGNTAPGVAGSAGSNTATVSGNSANTTPGAIGFIGIGSAFTIDYVAFGNFKALAYITPESSGSATYVTGYGTTMLMNIEGSTVTVDRYVEFPSGSTSHSTFSLANNTVVSFTAGESSASDETGYYKFYDNNFVCSLCTGTAFGLYTHTHGSHNHASGSLGTDSHAHSNGSLTANNHSHPNGSYDVLATDIDHITVGDGVGEAGAVNSTSINIYLDFYTGGVWVNKYSILNTGKILDTNVDISNSGVYPDVPGYWRVRVEPITANADFAQGVIKIKHSLDN